MNIIPAILESDLGQIENRLQTVSGLVDIVQVDVCDGDFVPSVTFGGEGGSKAVTLMNLLDLEGPEVELDFMVNFKNHPDYLEDWLNLIQTHKPKRAIFHYGSINDWDHIFGSIDERSTEIYLAAHHQHDIQEVMRLYEQHNFKGVQVMGIEHVGFSGEAFHINTYNLISTFARQGIPVSVDGGVKLENAQKIADAGAQAIGVNSGLFGAEDIGTRYALFKNITPGDDPAVLI